MPNTHLLDNHQIVLGSKVLQPLEVEVGINSATG